MSGRLWQAAVGNKMDLTGMTEKDCAAAEYWMGQGSQTRVGKIERPI